MASRTRRSPIRDAQRAERKRNDPEWAENLRSGGDDDWSTDQQKITLEMIAALRPFTHASEEDGNSVSVSFRIPARLYRDVQRMFSKANDRYDLPSDMYRDIFTKGIFVVAFGLKMPTPMEMMVALVKHRRMQREDAAKRTSQLAQDLSNMSMEEKSDLGEVLREIVDNQPTWLKKVYRAEIKKYPELIRLYGRRLS